MVKKKDAFSFAEYNFRKNFGAPGIWIILAGCMLVFLWYGKGVHTFLQQENLQMSPWELFTALSNSSMAIRFLFIGFLLLIGGYPFLESGVEPYLIRSDRRSWFCGQVIYIAVVLFIYNVLIILSCCLILRSCISWQNDWSSSLKWARMQIDIPPELEMDRMRISSLISMGSPLAAAAFTFLMNMVWMCAIGLLYMAMTLFSRRAALGSMGYIFLADLAIRQDVATDKIFYISPLTWGRWMIYRELQAVPPILYGICGFIVISCCAILLIQKQLPKYDFRWDE